MPKQRSGGSNVMTIEEMKTNEIENEEMELYKRISNYQDSIERLQEDVAEKGERILLLEGDNEIKGEALSIRSKQIKELQSKLNEANNRLSQLTRERKFNEELSKRQNDTLAEVKSRVMSIGSNQNIEEFIKNPVSDARKKAVMEELSRRRAKQMSELELD